MNAVAWSNGSRRCHSAYYGVKISKVRAMLCRFWQTSLAVPQPYYDDWFQWILRELNDSADGLAKMGSIGLTVDHQKCVEAKICALRGFFDGSCQNDDDVGLAAGAGWTLDAKLRTAEGQSSDWFETAYAACTLPSDTTAQDAEVQAATELCKRQNQR